MTRLVVSALLLGLSALPVRAQDTNLFQVLIDGEGWQAVNVPLPSAAVRTRGGLTFTSSPAEQAVYVSDSSGQKRKVAEGLGSPSALALSPDEGTLVVADAAGKHLYAFRVEKDGRLTCKDAYGTMLLPHGSKASGAAGMTVDSAGRFYVSTPVGIQVFDLTCRLSGIILPPAAQPGALAFGGPDGHILYVRCGDQLYARKTKAQGVPAAKP